MLDLTLDNVAMLISGLVAVLAWLLFDEQINRWTILGAAIIFIANAYIAHREAQLSRHAETSAPIEAAKPGE